MAIVWKFIVGVVLLIFGSVFDISHALPISVDDDGIDSQTISSNDAQIDNNGTAKDLYVIKTIVYEVGILTDIGNDTDNDTESHQEIDLTFFDPVQNGSFFNLSNIPIPIQTNVSGISVTGIAPASFGILSLPDGDVSEEATLSTNFPLHVPLLPNALINIKHNVSTADELNKVKLLEKIPSLLDLEEPVTGIPLKIETETEDNNDKRVIDTLKRESDEKNKEDS